MKKELFLFLFSLIISNNFLFAQKIEGYEISGKIVGLQEGERIVMKLFGKGADNIRTDSCVVTKGTFHLTGSVPEGPRLYMLVFDKHPHHVVSLLIDNGDKIVLQASDISQIPTGRIQYDIGIFGGETQRVFERMEYVAQLYSQMISSLNQRIRKIKDSIGFNPQLIEQLIIAKKQANAKFNYVITKFGVSSQSSNSNALPSVLDMYAFEPTIAHAFFLPDLYEKLNEERKNSFYGRILKERAVLSIGQSFPNFVLPDINGKPVSSKEIISKSKVTLIHFWAPNSYGRDIYQNELRTMYKDYHTKGLEVIGVNSDSVAVDWKVRVQAEQYPWFNVSDLKGKNGIVEKVYHEYNTNNIAGSNNTTNALIDPQGKIIAWDVSGPELQWYLWKYL